MGNPMLRKTAEGNDCGLITAAKVFFLFGTSCLAQRASPFKCVALRKTTCSPSFSWSVEQNAYKPYRCMLSPQRVGFLSRFGLKTPGYRVCPFRSRIGYGFRGNYAMTYEYSERNNTCKFSTMEL